MNNSDKTGTLVLKYISGVECLTNINSSIAYVLFI